MAQGGSFVTGQAARLVIGQNTFTAADPNSSNTVIGGASGVAFGGDTLFVADSNGIGALPSNNRVLLFTGASSMFPSPTEALTYNTKCPVCVGQASVVLGQPDFTTKTLQVAASSSALRNPTALASDGVHLVVADTDHNRVLIWNSIPTVNDQPADVVVGQPDFVTITPSSSSPTAKSLRGPSGVWIQNGQLYIADTQDNRILIYNHIPTSNGAAADVVLGAANFTTNFQPTFTEQATSATATNMLDPVSVTSDGTRMFVADLGYNRVLVWNSIPTTNGKAADYALGQPDLVSSTANNAYTFVPTSTGTASECSVAYFPSSDCIEKPVLCPTVTGQDSNGNSTYDAICPATLNFPRFALSTGTRLFIADGGNDRIVVFNEYPTHSGSSADLVIGEIGNDVDQASDATDSMNTPTSLAWDGTNLYAADPYNRRITVYSAGFTWIPYQGITNAASVDIVANGTITIGGTITANDVITVTIAAATNTNVAATYTYTVKATDTLGDIVQALVNAINSSNSGAGDPDVIATVDTTANEVVLTSRNPGSIGNAVSYSTTLSTSATETATAAGADLAGGNDSATIGPGTIVTIQGYSLSSQTASADTSQPALPTNLGNTTVYFNGIPAPLFYVSPGLINAQIPWEVNDTTSINAYVRSVRSDGSVMTTTPVAVTIVPANPGIYTIPNTNPVMAQAFHGSNNATGIVSVDGTVNASDIAEVTVGDRSYSYTVQAGDTLDIIRDGLIAEINQDPAVTARAAGVYDRIIIQARVEGPIGNNIPINATQSGGADVVMTPFAPTLCCANVEGAPITSSNPAVPGELIEIYATGLGLPVLTDALTGLLQTGVLWPANAPETTPGVAVSSLAGGSTADVLSATLLPGSAGLFKVLLHLNSGLPTNAATQLTIAQSYYVSNIVNIPVVGGDQ